MRSLRVGEDFDSDETQSSSGCGWQQRNAYPSTDVLP